MIVWSKQGDTSDWKRTPLATPLSIGAATLVPFVEHHVARAALVTAAGADLTLNGYAPLAVTVLEERDTIVTAGVQLRFTHYDPAEPAPLPAADAGKRCSRCRRVLDADEVCLRCPACASFAHERPTLACFSYDPLTGCCGRARAELAWTPADDEEDADAAA
jgi:hypothetical protein